LDEGNKLNKNIKIENDFLPQKEFDKIQEFMFNSPKFPWFYGNKIDSIEDDVNKFQFVHIFYVEFTSSQYVNILSPILNRFQPLSIFRIKANLRTRTSKNEESSFHSDMDILSEEKRKQWTTSIFYMNTNNGYTKFENGTKVNSVANRMITFPTNMKHTGTSCTDEKTRVVINFNYYEI
jgi:hypothetical protein